VRLKRDRNGTDTRAPLLQRPVLRTPKTGDLVGRSVVVLFAVTDLTFAAAPALAQNVHVQCASAFTNEGQVLSAPAALAGAGNDDVSSGRALQSSRSSLGRVLATHIRPIDIKSAPEAVTAGRPSQSVAQKNERANRVAPCGGRVVLALACPGRKCGQVLA
jgi:hypothetical protein